MPLPSYFNAHHSPIGAFSSFTLGFPGKSGGFDLEKAQPPKENIFIMVEDAAGGTYQALPFCENGEDESKRYDVESAAPDKPALPLWRTFAKEEITRIFKLGSDTWTAGGLTFRLYSQAMPVPDPEQSADEELAHVLLPAILAEITVDNTHGQIPRKALFGYQGAEACGFMRRIEAENHAGITGIGYGRNTAIVTSHPEVVAAQHFTIDRILQETHVENYKFGLGSVAALLMEVPPGQSRTYRFALCFYRGGYVTAGIDASYWYTRFYRNIEEVGQYALNHFDQLKESSLKADARIDGSKLSDSQAFMLTHAIRSYYGSSQLLDWQGRPFWIVNEGEYRMMNTFDLTADQLFYEIRMNPWTVRNELELYAERYSYRDQVRFPGDDRLYPGGISFTHDMGVGNAVSRPGYSAYELAGLDDCFSHMTHEQLVNWVLCAAVYVWHTKDQAWLSGKLPLLLECLDSMVNRDHPDPGKRSGVMGLDSSRCKGGAEITTYDSLDVSLGQSRNNLYLAGKCWAAYVALEKIFRDGKQPEAAALAGGQADRCAATIVSHMTEEGYIPAVMGENNHSRIIPAIEGLVFPYACGCPEALDPHGRFAAYIGALKQHLQTVLVQGVCLFGNGAWKLSSTSGNSWLSKIYLCQFVARHLLELPWDEAGKQADRAHADWLTDPQNAIWSWSDQMLDGVAVGSKYYPRGVTAILWLDE